MHVSTVPHSGFCIGRNLSRVHHDYCKLTGSSNHRHLTRRHNSVGTKYRNSSVRNSTLLHSTTSSYYELSLIVFQKCFRSIYLQFYLKSFWYVERRGRFVLLAHHTISSLKLLKKDKNIEAYSHRGEYDDQRPL